MVFNRFLRRADPSIEHRIRHALNEIPGVLRSESLIVELVEFSAESGLAVIRCHGDCPDCDMTAAMFIQGIEAHLKMHVPEVRVVRATLGQVRS
ncbi:MAG: NifU family protein [Gemmatimonadaceae bacterium]